MVECLIFYSMPLIARSIFTGDSVQFDLLDVDINLGMNRLHTHRAKIDCKYCKVSLRGEKRPYICFYGHNINKPCSLRSAMRANKLPCQASTEYWCIPPKKLSRMFSPNDTMIFILTRFLVLKPF